MGCEKPKDCLECPSCIAASNAHEAKLDKIQAIIESEIKDSVAGPLMDEHDLEMLAAGIVNELERTNWLNLGDDK